MSQPPKPGKPAAKFFLHDGSGSSGSSGHSGSPGDSSSSGGSSQDEGGNTGPPPIPSRLLHRAPQPAPQRSMHPRPGAGAVPYGGGAASHYAAAPTQRPFEFTRDPPQRRRPAPAGGLGGAPVPTDARVGGNGPPAASPYPGGGWMPGPAGAAHAAGSGQPGPSNFAGSLGNPVYTAHGHLPPPPPQHPAAGRGRPAQGRPLQAPHVDLPRAESNDICQFCGLSLPASQLTAHKIQKHSYKYGSSGY